VGKVVVLLEVMSMLSFVPIRTLYQFVCTNWHIHIAMYEFVYCRRYPFPCRSGCHGFQEKEGIPNAEEVHEKETIFKKK
jgi:hypothetical protein